MYCKGLDDIDIAALQHAFKQALRHLGDFMPSIGQIRTYAEELTPDPDEASTREILARPDKPAGWVPLVTDQEAGKVAHRLVGYVKEPVSKEEIAQWLEEGKQKQRDHIAKLEADPEWRKMAARLGGKMRTTEDLARERNGGSNIPADPEERKRWARDLAEKRGWR